MADGIARVLHTVGGEPVKVIQRNGDNILVVHSSEFMAALAEIRTELRIMNRHLAIMNGVELEPENVEGGKC